MISYQDNDIKLLISVSFDLLQGVVSLEIIPHLCFVKCAISVKVSKSINFLQFGFVFVIKNVTLFLFCFKAFLKEIHRRFIRTNTNQFIIKCLDIIYLKHNGQNISDRIIYNFSSLHWDVQNLFQCIYTSFYII